MRLHIYLEEELVQELDRRAGRGRRSAFIVGAVRRALGDAQRWDEIESAIDSLPDAGHAWDRDPARWVHDQRHTEK